MRLHHRTELFITSSCLSHIRRNNQTGICSEMAYFSFSFFSRAHLESRGRKKFLRNQIIAPLFRYDSGTNVSHRLSLLNRTRISPLLRLAISIFDHGLSQQCPIVRHCPSNGVQASRLVLPIIPTKWTLFAA